jgi:hypothetical protein
VNAFYPYVAGKAEGTMRRNPFVVWDTGGRNKAGTDPDDFPFGLAAVPVSINDNGIPYECKFYGGLVGVAMNATDYEVKPVSGFSIQLMGA